MCKTYRIGNFAISIDKNLFLVRRRREDVESALRIVERLEENLLKLNTNLGGFNAGREQPFNL
jgi:hypothetical protein